jgi:hypothetical protein
MAFTCLLTETKIHSGFVRNDKVLHTFFPQVIQALSQEKWQTAVHTIQQVRMVQVYNYV